MQPNSKATGRPTSAKAGRVSPRRLVLAGFLATMFAGGFWLGVERMRPDRPRVQLQVNPKDLDFGEAWLQTGFEWELPVHNPTRRDVRVERIECSCACVEVEPSAFTVPASGTVRLRVTADLSAKTPRGGSSQEWEFCARLAPVVEGAVGEMHDWKVRGTVRKLLDLVPAELNFSETLVEGEPFPAGRIRVRCLRPLKGLSADCDPHLASLRVRSVLEERNTSELEILPSEELPVGRFRFPVSIRAQLEAGSASPTVELAVYGRVVHDLQVTPSSVFVGPVELGQMFERTFVVASRTGKPVAVKDIDCDSPNVEIRATGEASSSRREYGAWVRVNQGGPQSTELRFTVTAEEDGALSRIVVPLSWHGVLPPSGKAARSPPLPAQESDTRNSR